MTKVAVLEVGRDGRVWAMEPGRMPAAAAGSVDEYLGSAAGRRLEAARARGTVGNAGLLVRLYAMRVRGDLDALDVCSPAAGGGRRAADDPAACLVRMARVLGPASTGGWHPFVDLDYPAYAIAATTDPDDRVRFLKTHCAYHALSFVPDLDLPAAAAIVGAVLDPRFFVDPEHPDRTTRLERFLGVSPRGAPDRLREVVACCVGAARGGADRPGAFAARPGALADMPGAAGPRAFVRFLAAAWTDALYPGRPEPVFDPDVFFAEPWTSAAYRRHAAARLG